MFYKVKKSFEIYLDSVKIALYNLFVVKIDQWRKISMQEKPYHHGNLRNSLIEVGISLIHKEGVDHLSLRRVASLCGVSQAAPYAHFANKEALLDAMRAYATERFKQALEDAKQAVPDEDDPKLLLEMGKRYVLFFLENPQYFNFIYSQPWMQVYLDINNDAEDNFPPYQLLKTHSLRIFRKAGIPDERIEDMLISMWSTVHGLTSIATMSNIHYSKNWSDKIEDIITNV